MQKARDVDKSEMRRMRLSIYTRNVPELLVWGGGGLWRGYSPLDDYIMGRDGESTYCYVRIRLYVCAVADLRVARGPWLPLLDVKKR